MSTSFRTIERPSRPESPSKMHRLMCWPTKQLAVSGDLPMSRTAAKAQLLLWEQEGITDVFDMRGEANDTQFIHENSSIRCHWWGVDDNGGTRSDGWFESFVLIALLILVDPKRKILVHCHMGVNRGPSALYAIMIAAGWNHLDALRAIRDSRPIAGIIYAPDAVNWFGRSIGLSPQEIESKVSDVRSWLSRNYLDIGYVIRSIGSKTA